MPNCEMCGKESRLAQADISGAELKVCSNCARFGVVKRETGVKNFNRSSRDRFVKREEPELKIADDYSSLIRSARESKGMKQEDFSKFLNEKESIVAKWEQGTLRPRIDVARRLEKALGIKLVVVDESKKVEVVKQKKSDGFTLGDFVKVRRKNGG